MTKRHSNVFPDTIHIRPTQITENNRTFPRLELPGGKARGNPFPPPGLHPYIRREECISWSFSPPRTGVPRRQPIIICMRVFVVCHLLSLMEVHSPWPAPTNPAIPRATWAAFFTGHSRSGKLFRWIRLRDGFHWISSVYFSFSIRKVSDVPSFWSIWLIKPLRV